MTHREPFPGDDTLSPAVTALIDDYFARFRNEAHTADAPGLNEVVADLRDHVLTRLEPTSCLPDDAVRVLAELGSPAELAAGFVDSSTGGDEGGSSALTGRLLGVPYDLRAPTSERYAARWWNPLDRRVFVPKALGMGWSVNFGALAVLTRIVRPDDEDVPFASVPPRVVAGTLLAPVVVLAAFAVIAASSWAALPARVPSHWGITGQIDGYLSSGSALSLMSALAAVPVALAGWVHLRRRAPLNRIGASALSLSLATLALAVLAQTLFAVGGGGGVGVILAGLACSLLLPFALLIGVARIGRNAERRRDLTDASRRKGTTNEP
jgi:hypothetical protein